MSSNKKQLIRIIAGAVVYVGGFIAEHFIPDDIGKYVLPIVFAAALLIAGVDVIINAVRGIIHGQVFDESFLMAVATIGAFAIGEYPEGVAVMLFYQVGELFQSYAVNKSRKSISSLMDIRPDYANVKKGDTVETVDPYDVEIGDIIVIKPGERVPLDAIVIEGNSLLDTVALTGESVPRSVSVGDALLSGCINQTGLLAARVTKEFGESTASKILDLVENAADNKSKSEDFITKFARYYTPAVVIAALLLAIIPPIVIPNALFKDWIYRALTFLVISCPCALVISIPLSFFGGIGAASKKGVLVKGSNYLEDLSKTEIAVFDKTGTLTKGVFRVQSVHSKSVTPNELIKIAAHVESGSNHPISKSLLEYYGKEIDTSLISDVTEVAGHGITAKVDGVSYAVGNNKLMEEFGVEYEHTQDEIGTIVHVATDNAYCGYIVIADEIKSDSEQAISLLKKMGIGKTVMLTGDSKKIGKSVGKKLGLDEIYTELLPADKVSQVERLIKEKSEKGKLIFVGDGINDAPVLALSDIGIAMGGLGSDAAIEAADVVIMTDEPSKIATAIRISRKTLRIVKENIILALGIKFLVLLLGALGFAPMWAAVFADVGVAFIAILNAIRALKD
ncbi:MAG: cadmium-translocating P-type ATPase [Faecalibacterium sp.]|nr:cadmium-translocating P-type ATPase [Ruminococcus sp.]MCM1485522.1 cadmium-translocating P-type ATPase [Faecalibacterium sp.]